jgi:hypothetical protein
MAKVEAVIAALEEQNPQAVELAEAVSFAARVEPFLLRHMRLEVLPHVDSGAEADVWLSALVQVRSPEGLVFHPEVADTLRRRLRARNLDRFERTWTLVRECHAHLPPTLQLEEEIAWRSADPGVEALETIDLLLKRAAKTLVSAEGRQGMTNWAARALPRMPERVRSLEGARILGSAAYLRLARQLPAAEVDPKSPMPDWMAWILPSGLENTHVRVRLVADGIELSLGETGGETIPVPDMRPCVVEVSWKQDGREEVRQVTVERGQRCLVGAPARDYQIRTVLGERYRLVEKKKMPEQPKAREVIATCFVVMGFGKKTDYRTGRMLDLDQSYKNMIKPAVEAAGLRCLRADEIPHAGVIDAPMFDWLMKAEVVVADLSTSQPNTFYELGIRHTMRPYGTIVLAESEMVFPFDSNAIAIRRYKHLGDDIGHAEALRSQQELEGAIEAVISGARPDSPVYAFLQGLRPPAFSDFTRAAENAPQEAASAADQPAARVILDEAKEATSRGDWIKAKELLTVAHSILPNDVGVVQKLALATYKSRVPTTIDALQEARRMLLELHPENATDPETLGLWAAVHKRLWDATSERVALDTAIDASEKAFLLKNDYYNGINYAFLLNVRATQSPPPDAVADFVVAQRVRRKVIGICEELLRTGAAPAEQYWILGTLAEAWLGVGERVRSQEAMSRASSMSPEKWMIDSTAEQLSHLEKLLADSPLDRAGLRGPSSAMR